MALLGKVGVPVLITTPIYELDGTTRAAGLADLLTVQVLVGGVDAALAISVAEFQAQAGPEYLIQFTPTVVGLHDVRITYPPFLADIGEQVQVYQVDIGDLAGHIVLPVSRAPIDVGQVVELTVRFNNLDGTTFDPAELRQVVITDHDTGIVLFTIGALDIVRVEQGLYRVVTPIALGGAVTLGDRWYYKAFAGDPERTRAFSKVVAAVVGAEDLLVSVARLKRHELGGVNLSDNDGNPLALETFEEAIREASDQLGAELDIKLRPEAVTERHDYRLSNYQNFGWFEVDERPVHEIISVIAKFQGSQYQLAFPTDWFLICDKMFGSFNLVPQSGTLEQFLVANAGGASGTGALLPVLRPGMHTFWPSLFEVKYMAGFYANDVPPRMKKAIALLASIEILNIAGEMIIGSGIASKSISIGGLSQSVNTTSSATNAGHGALIIQYMKQLDKLIPELKRQFHGVSIGSA